MSTKFSAIAKPSSFVARLPPDPVLHSPEVARNNPDNVTHTPRILDSGAYSFTLPEPRKSYKYLTSSPTALRDVGLNQEAVEDPQYRKIVSGEAYFDAELSKLLPPPHSQAYAGWQFGQFAGQLGDGRVVNLFEVAKNKSDASQNRKTYEVQLKGAGLTPFSRFADGKAVLRSSIREYTISEHLNAIGIPTTRALALVYLPETLARRSMYEKCAVVTRFAESWVRLGTFDLYRMRGDSEGLRQLCGYCIDELFTVDGVKFPLFSRFYEQFPRFFGDIDELTDYDKFFFEVVLRNAVGTAKWQTYGFLNGVLNTDNTSVLGLSMDYGPFSIMDKFKPGYTPNSEDLDARYGYRNTPTAIWWNLTRFGENLAGLVGAGPELIDLPEEQLFANEDKVIKRATKIIEIGGHIYTHAFTQQYVESFYNRLGLSTQLVNRDDPDEQNQRVVAPLVKMLEKVECDFNKFFVNLQQLDHTSGNMDFRAMGQALKSNNNELYNDDEMIELISDWLKVYQQELAKSESLGFDRANCKQYNPLFLPRNWILDEVIERTQDSNAEDISYLKKLEKMSLNPFDSSKWGDELKDVERKWLQQGDLGEKYSMLQCSCSS
ncbi:hypothetical protein CANTEDRAFT_126711 [Yamadazyma tenuis ATCC 10573]|uniref:Selenoprotein O n=2 Tax=Candida tenuis TaxID=2315449 RepID=G3BF08_CANTC|nr:uncharacterized protein CANTEDRAFT_126711 [Yamadazyma tenuis ATCC 10573]EGV59981.1 hypothetical protein CANTEDRAFT_126711 [Yamadazyma tenuis ATCC 10573]